MRATTRLSSVILLLLAGAAMAQAPAPKAGGKKQAAKPPMASASSPAAAEPARNLDAEEGIYRILEDAFRLPGDLAVDADLRVAAQEIATEHLARTKAQLPALVAQEQRANTKPLGSSDLQWRLYARFINEFALMRLESTGPAFDAAWLAAALKPRFCDVATSESLFSNRVVMMQQVPLAQRAVVLDGERLLLQRWGTSRQGLSERPSPTVDEQVAVLIGNIKAGTARPALAMTPILAHVHLNSSDEEPTDHWWQRCLSAQWWLRMQPLDSEAARGRALNDFRHATLLLAEDMMRPPSKRPPGNAADYPQLASRFGVEGVLRLLLRIDATGSLQRADVIKRDITVRGIRDNPPVAFDTLLDQAAKARAEAISFKKPAPAALKNGVLIAEQEYQFRLDHPNPGKE